MEGTLTISYDGKDLEAFLTSVIVSAASTPELRVSSIMSGMPSRNSRSSNEEHILSAH
jgi:hypothetical protein